VAVGQRSADSGLLGTESGRKDDGWTVGSLYIL
jgi:hypothetical protein